MNRVLRFLMLAAICPFTRPAQMSSQPPPAAQTQSSRVTAEASPVASAVRFSLERQSKNISAAVDEMPADKFSYRPTPAQITFGHLVMHMAGSNFRLCAAISGTEAPPMEELKETDPKETLAAALKSSFDFCTQSLAKVDDSKLAEVVLTRGSFSLTRAAAMMALTNDFADHYSAAAIYLRLNGLLPPTAQPRKE
ncbi:MAG: DinB family protein [Candidatus Acidiferrales bacterium]